MFEDLSKEKKMEMLEKLDQQIDWLKEIKKEVNLLVYYMDRIHKAVQVMVEMKRRCQEKQKGHVHEFHVPESIVKEIHKEADEEKEGENSGT